jgi:hypothetical protein
LVCKDEEEFSQWTDVLMGLHERKIPEHVLAVAKNSQRPPRRTSMSASKFRNATGTLKRDKRRESVNGADGNTTDDLTSAFTGKSDVYAWGAGDWGQTGHGDMFTLHTPAIVQDTLGKGVQSIALGLLHGVLLLDSGKMLTQGNRLGSGLSMDVSIPMHVQVTPSLVVSSVVCGDYHSVAITGTFDKFNAVANFLTSSQP